MEETLESLHKQVAILRRKAETAGILGDRPRQLTPSPDSLVLESKYDIHQKQRLALEQDIQNRDKEIKKLNELVKECSMSCQHSTLDSLNLMMNK